MNKSDSEYVKRGFWQINIIDHIRNDEIIII